MFAPAVASEEVAGMTVAVLQSTCTSGLLLGAKLTEIAVMTSVGAVTTCFKKQDLPDT